MPNPTEVLSQSFLYDYIARTLSTEYLGEIEKEFENTLACLSGAYTVDGLNHQKLEVKILVAQSL